MPSQTKLFEFDTMSLILELNRKWEKCVCVCTETYNVNKFNTFSVFISFHKLLDLMQDMEIQASTEID